MVGKSEHCEVRLKRRVYDYKPGDRVKVKPGVFSIYAGMSGTVTDYERVAGLVHVQFPDVHRPMRFYPHEVEKEAQ